MHRATHQHACYFAACNRNKRSVTVDMATPEGQAIIRELAKDSDVVVENFKTGGLQRYGLDYASLAALNPRLIYCSVTGFGHTGPYAPRAGYDLLIQAMSGLMSITGRADSEPGGGPLRVGVAVIDLFTGMYATSAILSALEARHHTGRGQHIDMALLDVAMAVLANQGTGFLNTGSIPAARATPTPAWFLIRTFPRPTAHAAGDRQRRPVRTLLRSGRRGLAPGRALHHERGPGHSPRGDGGHDVRADRSRSTADWIALLEARAVPCGPINNIRQAFEDPHVQARGLRITQQRYRMASCRRASASTRWHHGQPAAPVRHAGHAALCASSPGPAHRGVA
jgi:crotonobetainyl-CoA:carnitine CoA-transferase CaiB-like acyl-CoA transferase